MRLLSPTLGVLLLGSLLAACDGSTAGSADGTTSSSKSSSSSSSSKADVGEVLATVNGVQIGVSDFEEAAARKTPESGDSLSAEEKQEVLDRLVEEKLLYKAALEKGLDQDPKVQKVMVNTLLREVVYANVRNSDFSDEELQAYYEANKDDFVVPEKVQIKRILIKIKDDRPDADAKAEAERLRAEVVKNPDDFKELASKHSEDPYRRRGGDVGFVARTGKPGLDDAVVEKAFTMNVGDVSEVFLSEDGYNIVTVANKRERVERTFQQMKGSVLRKVKNERLKDLYEGFVADLKTSATVDIDQAKLSSIEVSPARRPMTPGLSLEGGMTPKGVEDMPTPDLDDDEGDDGGEGSDDAAGQEK